MENTNYEIDKESIYYAYKALYAVRTDNLKISKELLEEFLNKCKDKDTEIQEIRDLLIAAEVCIQEAKKKLDNILEILA